MKRRDDSHDDQYTEVGRFIEENEGFVTNALVQSFLKNKQHQCLLEQFLQQATIEAAKELDTAFQEHYAEIRLTSLLSSNIRRYAIRFDQKKNRESQRHLLILDKPVRDDEDTVPTNLEMMKDNQALPIDQLVIERANDLENQIENPALYRAIRSLTPRQRYILESAYLLDMKDTEIAVNEGVSQQSITKTRKKALSKMKKQLTGDYI
ncbi:sigma-70 family RNA polymerase sigma factor [Halobacillus shinanisalinarum]|uniref:Sigma-70 family RNA polymerase sigma factor n=1 Tax=Halobacillus shinanisalinarum TaxID=2932258 RepID=A0ABY4GUF0_9BACI|nr:sigma-70 family RNA polymerase sigma factor [Halobacillus shinanisalinarum]UOQ91576.1 sigma-70 family RNA polymerase sigma factor [Halobacillus shinanisalinarum]